MTANVSPIGGGPEFVVDFTITAEELTEFWMWEEYRRPRARRARGRRKRKKLKFALLVACATLAVCAIFLAGVWWHSRTLLAGSLVATLGIAGCWFFVLLNLLPMSERRYARYRLRQAQGICSQPQTAVRIRLSKEGIATETTGGLVVIPWSGIALVDETPLLIVSKSHDGETGFFPKRLLGEGSAAEAAHQTILGWIHDAGGGQHNALVPGLAERDAPCPNCGYNLRGIKEPVCPECGEALDPDDVSVRKGQGLGARPCAWILRPRAGRGG